MEPIWSAQRRSRVHCPQTQRGPIISLEEVETEKSIKRTRRRSKPGGPTAEGGRSHKRNILPEMASKHCRSEEEERQMESLCGLHRLEQGVSQGSIPNAQDWSTSRRHVWAPEDELPGCLLGLPPDCLGARGPRKDSIYIPECKLSLRGHAIWIEERRSHVPTDDEENVLRINRMHGWSIYWWHGGKKQKRVTAYGRPPGNIRDTTAA